MKRWDAQHIAHNAGARLLHAPMPAASAGEAGSAVGVHAAIDTTGGPDRVVVSSHEAGPGVLFVGLPGENVHGGTFAAQALRNGAWGVLTAREHAEALGPDAPGAVIAADDPLTALQRLARAWRRELGAQVIGVTGSTGKTSTKDLLSAILRPQRRTVATQANLNTEIGLPLQILSAPEGTEILVLEMGMRGSGQIAELAAIAEPDVGLIVGIGPVHLEQLGTIENIAAAKAELLAALPAGAVAIIPANEPLLDPHLRADLRFVRFGPGGDVTLVAESEDTVTIGMPDGELTLEVGFTQPYMRANLIAAVATARAVGVTARGRVELELTPGRGQLQRLQSGVLLLDGSYNGNPTSMRAALAELDRTARQAGGMGGTQAGGVDGTDSPARRIAVLGDMRELGPQGPDFHVEIGRVADACADVLVTVGALAAQMNGVFHGENHHVADAEQAAELVPTLLRKGDVVLVKGSLAMALKQVSDRLRDGAEA